MRPTKLNHSDKMRIAIINITGGGISGGYRKYLVNLLPKMSAHPDVEAILCASPSALNVRGWFSSIPRVEFYGCPPFRMYNRYGYGDLRRRINHFCPDVIFIPVERSLRFNNVPVVHMLQNMEPFVKGIEGNPLIERIRQFFLYIDAKDAIKRSTRVIAISAFVKNFLINKWNIPKEKIGLVNHGIDPYQTIDRCRPDTIPDGWDGQFLFTAGSIRPARGLEDAILAMKYLRSKHTAKKLVIGGVTEANVQGYQNRLRKLIQDNNFSSTVCWAGRLSDEEMAWCYDNCSIFLMTSRVESFSMIALEAKMFDCLCISTDIPSLKEVFGNGVLYYHPKDFKMLAGLIQTQCDVDRKILHKIFEEEHNVPDLYSWDVCTGKTIKELQIAIQAF